MATLVYREDDGSHTLRIMTVDKCEAEMLASIRVCLPETLGRIFVEHHYPNGMVDTTLEISWRP